MLFPEMETSMIPVHSEDYKTPGKYYNDEILSLVSCMTAWSLQLCLIFATPGTVAGQAPLSTGFFRQE